MPFSSLSMTSFLLTLGLFIMFGLLTLRFVKSGKDFSTGGRRAGWGIVAGTIMGTLVGGASTIGTAQLAFQYGFSAWWFTLGGGIACAVLGFVFLKRVYQTESATIPQLLARNYNRSTGVATAVFSSLGIFLNIIAQGLAAFALLTSIIPLAPVYAAIVCFFLVFMYLYWGGIWSTGYLGIAKIAVLLVVTLASGVLAFSMLGGSAGLESRFVSFPWLSLFGRGYNTDLAAGFSLVVGVLSTQTYFQAVFAAKSLKQARVGVFLSSLLIPLVGVGGILVGLFMRANFPNTASDQVLPVFIMHFFPPILAGILFAVLMITIIGTWAGLTLGVTTMLTQDIYHRLINPFASDRMMLRLQRVLILVLTAVSLFFVVGNLQSLILGWSFLSMGLRGCTILPALIGALFFPKKVSPIAGLMSAIVGPLTTIVWYYWNPMALDALYPGLFLGTMTLIVISFLTRKRLGKSF